jgi:hypothetical protein
MKSFAVVPNGGLPLTVTLDQRLGCHHVLNFGRADAEREAAERAMGRRVAVAADHGHTRLGQALLWPNDVDNALADIVDAVIGHAEIFDVLFQRLDLDARFVVLNATRPVDGRHVVIGDGQCFVRTSEATAGSAKALKRLGAGHFVDQMQVDINQAGAVFLGCNQVVLPNLVKQGARRRHRRFLPKEVRIRK